MLNMIRAELYRLRHCGIFLLLIVIASVVMSLGMYAIMSYPKFDALDLAAATDIMGQTPWLLALCVVATIMGIYIGTSYNNRMSYYEIMNGYSPLKIIISKVISIGGSVSFIAVFPSALLMFFLWMSNGSGTIDNVARYFIMLVLTFVNAIVVSVLYAMLSRNIALASFVAYIRLAIVDMLPIVLAASLKPELMEGKWAYIPITGRLMRMTMVDSWEPVKTSLVAMLVECIIVSVLVYLVYKKKRFK